LKSRTNRSTILAATVGGQQLAIITIFAGIDHAITAERTGSGVAAVEAWNAGIARTDVTNHAAVGLRGSISAGAGDTKKALVTAAVGITFLIEFTGEIAEL
jgi:hypothetical protein